MILWEIQPGLLSFTSFFSSLFCFACSFLNAKKPFSGKHSQHIYKIESYIKVPLCANLLELRTAQRTARAALNRSNFMPVATKSSSSGHLPALQQRGNLEGVGSVAGRTSSAEGEAQSLTPQDVKQLIKYFPAEPRKQPVSPLLTWCTF